MEFKLKINPGKEAEIFLEGRVAALHSAELEDGLARLKKDIRHIFTGGYEKLKKDTRFNHVFVKKRVDLRGEQTSLGENLINSFSILDRFYADRLSEREKALSRTEVTEEYFNTKLKALENIFAGDVSVFEHILIMTFLNHTCQQEKLEGEKLQKAEERFREFIGESEPLLRFFYYLNEFNRLNRLRVEIDQDKKSSLSEALEDEICGMGTIAAIEGQILICRKLEYLARRLIEISKGHDPLDGIKRALDEVYSAEGNQNLINVLLEKFRKYYEVELDMSREALVYKRMIHLNSGSKEARINRKKWLESIGDAEVNRLVNLLEIKDESGKGLSQVQKGRQELFQILHKKLDEGNRDQADESKLKNTLEEGDMNLLVLRLDNVSLLEDQITAVEKRIEEHRKQKKVDYQNINIRSYNDNITRLTQCLYFFLELSIFRKPSLEMQGKEKLMELRKEMSELDAGLKAEMSSAEEKSAGESVAGADPGKNETTEQKAVPGSESRPSEEQKSEEEEQEPEEKMFLLAEKLKELPDSARIKPLKELAYFGSLKTLHHLLPIYQSSRGFLRKVALNTVIKIILRALREDETRNEMGIQQKKKLTELVAGLDKKYSFLGKIEVDDPETRQKIYDIVIKEDKEFTARTLAEILVDTDERVRATAVKLIAEMLNQEETGLLVKLLGDPDPRVRANVIESLEEIGNRNVLGILMKYKFNKNNRVRANAIKAVWNFGHRDVYGSLEEMMLDFEPKMRASATWVIGEIGHNQPELKNLLYAVENDNNEMVKRNLVEAKRKITMREKGLLVLVADDDKEFCQKINRGLAADGYKTSIVHNGRDALEAAENHNPNAILLNLRIPVMNGLEVIKALRAKKDTSKTPVIVFCDLNTSVLINRVRKAGADSYLIKPCSYEQVKRELQNSILKDTCTVSC